MGQTLKTARNTQQRLWLRRFAIASVAWLAWLPLVIVFCIALPGWGNWKRVRFDGVCNRLCVSISVCTHVLSYNPWRLCCFSCLFVPTQFAVSMYYLRNAALVCGAALVFRHPTLPRVFVGEPGSTSQGLFSEHETGSSGSVSPPPPPPLPPPVPSSLDRTAQGTARGRGSGRGSVALPEGERGGNGAGIGAEIDVRVGVDTPGSRGGGGAAAAAAAAAAASAVRGRGLLSTHTEGYGASGADNDDGIGDDAL